MAITLVGCATHPTAAFKGHWQPVNHYAAVTQEIPLTQAYVFYPSPLDGTLKHMLARWAKDSDMTLSYQHQADFTLHVPVAQIRTSSLHEALALLAAAYAPQRLSLSVEHNQIVVRLDQTAGMSKVRDKDATAVLP